VIAVNQDPMGRQGYCVHGANTDIRVYVRELLPSDGVPCEEGASDTWAVVLANFISIFREHEIYFDPKEHLPNGDSWKAFHARDLVYHVVYDMNERITVRVDESSVRMFKVVRHK
jgi:hypothetical protein